MPDLRPLSASVDRKAQCSATLRDEIISSLRQERGLLADTSGPHDIWQLVQWIDDERAKNYILVTRAGLRSLEDWRFNQDGYLSHRDGKFFKVIGVRVSSTNREVRHWSQPMIDNEGSGVIGLLIKRWEGRVLFLMQAKADVGNRNLVQIGPTVQFNPGNYKDCDALKKPFLFHEFQDSSDFLNVIESKQSEEGGRFFREEHMHKVLLLPEGMALELPPEYRWLCAGQIRFFLQMGDYVNSCARSILSLLI